VIDLSSEATLGLQEAAKILPPFRLGRPVSYPSVLRWIIQGAKSLDGRVVRLEAVRVGSRWVTSKEALQRFAERLTAATTDSQLSPDTATHRPKARGVAS
jgi:hypothetical protein